MYIIPADVINEADNDNTEDAIRKSLNFTWNLTEISGESNIYNFKLIFDDPFAISPYEI